MEDRLEVLKKRSVAQFEGKADMIKQMYLKAKQSLDDGTLDMYSGQVTYQQMLKDMKTPGKLMLLDCQGSDLPFHALLKEFATTLFL